MAKVCRIMSHFTLSNRIEHRISGLRRRILRLLHHFLLCSGGKPSKYLMLPHFAEHSPPSLPPSSAGEATHVKSGQGSLPEFHTPESDSDLVALKLSLLGDCQIGKTSFLVKYIGNEHDQRSQEKKGLNQMDKTLVVEGARISYCIWEVEGGGKSQHQIPLACKDSVAILYMFDLTSRCTLNSVIGWYKEARKWNQTAIPVMIGTKFDDFIQLPIDLQWTIANEARRYAKAMNATLFFSSATYNINVNKIFKFITAKLFDLPWTLERNLTVEVDIYGPQESNKLQILILNAPVFAESLLQLGVWLCRFLTAIAESHKQCKLLKIPDDVERKFIWARGTA
ncbi:septum-promoting GTP-binding protein 1 isoform X2 [Prosopis cineraria]|uniref:septum-promoting GTP-binding protein 1 isoform X2 n=1 Tax=Prosopis cineraria TaxID=364024 RepID=UPI002410B507|nr:septum-promoting GTP-binding protein 1 isoform X2 [Prosopis cineraria]